MKNEDGYALPTVLLIMLLFIVFTLAFFGQSLNSTKQNKKIETQSQSVALAEMGVEYFYQAVSNSYIKNQPIVENEIDKMKREDIENKIIRSPEYYTEKAKDLMITLLQGDLNGENKHIASNASFEIEFNKYNDVQPLHNGIQIQYTSIGKEERENSNIGATLTINLESSGIGDDSGSTSEVTMPDFNSIKKPENVKNECINPTKNNQIKNCSEILITNGDSDGDYKNKGNNKNNLLIYSTSSLNLKNANSMEYVNLHVHGQFNAKNLNNTKRTFIEVYGNATFEGKVDLDESSKVHVKGSIKANDKVELDRSKMVAGGAMTINKELDLDNKSQLIVGGSFDARDDVQLEENSYLYVGGSAKVLTDLKVKDRSFVYIAGAAHIVGKLDIDDNSKVCVAGSLAYGDLKNKGKLFVKGNNPKLFEKNCGQNDSNPSFWNEDIGRTIDYSNGN